jgi:hypothetical protein
MSVNKILLLTMFSCLSCLAEENNINTTDFCTVSSNYAELLLSEKNNGVKKEERLLLLQYGLGRNSFFMTLDNIEQKAFLDIIENINNSIEDNNILAGSVRTWANNECKKLESEVTKKILKTTLICQNEGHIYEQIKKEKDNGVLKTDLINNVLKNSEITEIKKLSTVSAINNVYNYTKNMDAKQWGKKTYQACLIKKAASL